jgi:hypothetical protein
MEDKMLEANLFAIKEKANNAYELMRRADTVKKTQFWYGQFLVFNEVYSLLSNSKV